jgi:hypothetical protein
MVEDRQSLAACFPDKEALPSLGWPISHSTGDISYFIQTATSRCLEATPCFPRLSAEATPWKGAPRGVANLRDV